MQTLIDDYHTVVKTGVIIDDPLQREVLGRFQTLLDALLRPQSRWFPWWNTPVKGVYLHGSVGVGKTFLVDLFYQRVPHHQKARFHFHHFMQQIDAKLRLMQGQKDPLRRIAKQLALSTRVLCLDECLVHDVADAMILAEMLQALFAQGIVLVVSANTHPDELYAGGVHRERFLPAIALFKQHCDVVLLTESRDYRLGRAPLSHRYVTPLDGVPDELLQQQFDALVTQSKKDCVLTIQKRPVVSVRSGDRCVWFEFDVICNVPRCQLDYLEIADRFDSVFVSNIPVLAAEDTARVILFIHFIDVMYDRGIRLIVSSRVTARNIYPEGPMKQSFQRTLSRLEEMQSVDYLARHQHREMNFLIENDSR